MASAWAQGASGEGVGHDDVDGEAQGGLEKWIGERSSAAMRRTKGWFGSVVRR